MTASSASFGSIPALRCWGFIRLVIPAKWAASKRGGAIRFLRPCRSVLKLCEPPAEPAPRRGGLRASLKPPGGALFLEWLMGDCRCMLCCSLFQYTRRAARGPTRVPAGAARPCARARDGFLAQAPLDCGWRNRLPGRLPPGLLRKLWQGRRELRAVGEAVREGVLRQLEIPEARAPNRACRHRAVPD